MPEGFIDVLEQLRELNLKERAKVLELLNKR
jgi:hypothetical protein